MLKQDIIEKQTLHQSFQDEFKRLARRVDVKNRHYRSCILLNICGMALNTKVQREREQMQAKLEMQELPSLTIAPVACRRACN